MPQLWYAKPYHNSSWGLSILRLAALYNYGAAASHDLVSSIVPLRVVIFFVLAKTLTFLLL